MTSQHDLTRDYARVRSLTLDLCRTLAPEDTVVQSMPDVSPTKWHLAHVTWFFERFVLEHFDAGYRRFNEAYDYLFNSYYYSVGQMHARPQRGLLTRPTLQEVRDYREHVDAAIAALLDTDGDNDELRQRLVLGLNHEQQHQELLLTDIKHVFSCNPMQPAVDSALPVPTSTDPGDYAYTRGTAGIQSAGHSGDGFCFDNETPRHEVLLHPHEIGTRLVTNSEFRDFIRDGGYRDSNLWLSDGWSAVNAHGWSRPLYWGTDLESEFTLGGVRELDGHAPVCHVSYYEADAFARWAGARLPTEFEWEVAAREHDVCGNLMDSRYWHPAAGSGQFFGDAWEWTSSPYGPYPGFKPLEGALGEYNGKFMCNQVTVRGGSCVTAADHLRPTYRSFFYPEARWQFLGIRLARDPVA
jgi:ergothioneine biosynthesis protein EgtB